MYNKYAIVGKSDRFLKKENRWHNFLSSFLHQLETSMETTHKKEPQIEYPQNLGAINEQKVSGDFAPAEQQHQFPGYPAYPDGEDVYRAAERIPLEEEGDVIENRNPDAWNEETDFTGEDLDVPGAELDDQDEEIGREDEENNYYSLGGDNHDDKEEGLLG